MPNTNSTAVSKPYEIMLLPAVHSGFTVHLNGGVTLRPDYAGSLDDCLIFIKDQYRDGIPANN